MFAPAMENPLLIKVGYLLTIPSLIPNLHINSGSLVRVQNISQAFFTEKTFTFTYLYTSHIYIHNWLKFKEPGN